MLIYFVLYLKLKSNIFNSNSLATSPPKLQHLHLYSTTFTMFLNSANHALQKSLP